MTEIDTKLQDMLNSEFSDDEQKIFLQHFKGFISKDDEFVINIEFAVKWIGFTRKDVCKRLLEKNFILDSDYILNKYDTVFHSKVENSNEDDIVSPFKGGNFSKYKKKEGRPNEIILMNPNTFKQLCILSNTEKGKQVRLYYIKMESILIRYLKEKNEINEKLLSEANQMNKNLGYALQTEKEKNARMLGRRVNTDEPGQVVYIYKESEFKYKIGETINKKSIAFFINY